MVEYIFAKTALAIIQFVICAWLIVSGHPIGATFFFIAGLLNGMMVSITRGSQDEDDE